MSFASVTRSRQVHSAGGVSVALALDEADAPQRFVWFVERVAGDWVAVDLRTAAERAGLPLPVQFLSPHFADAWNTLGSAALGFVRQVGVTLATAEEAPAAPPAPRRQATPKRARFRRPRPAASVAARPWWLSN